MKERVENGTLRAYEPMERTGILRGKEGMVRGKEQRGKDRGGALGRVL